MFSDTQPADSSAQSAHPKGTFTMTRRTHSAAPRLLLLSLLTAVLLIGPARAVDLSNVADKAAGKAAGDNKAAEAANKLAEKARDHAEAPDIRASLLSDHSAVAPGEPFHLGVLIELPEGWHVYWRNPGDAGLATKVQWSLPEGFAAGPLRWPRPVTFSQPGEVTGFGYKNQVVLWTTVTPPEDLEPGQTIHLSADVSWLACKDQCAPGQKTATLELTSAEKSRPNPKTAPAFESWAKRTPRMASGFTLTDQAGKGHRLEDYRGKIVVLEWFNPDCPFVKRHHEKKTTMRDLAAQYAEKDVVWLAVNSTHYMTPEKTAEWHETWNMAYPVLIDRDGTVGRAYGAKSTPHMFILGTDGQILYEGAIDDAPRGGPASTVHVDAALADITENKPVGTPETRPYGCSVKYKK